MLLRQLYLAHFEQRTFTRALLVARQALELGILPDVIHQDAARACQALGDTEGAILHLRLAARISPPNRRPFHVWTLGSVLFLARRHADAASAFSRAARWGTMDKPLYQGHLALAQCESGIVVADLAERIERLVQVAAGQGYGRFVLGLLAAHAHRFDDARRWLEAFVRRTEAGRKVLAIALEGELALARERLEEIDRARAAWVAR